MPHPHPPPQPILRTLPPSHPFAKALVIGIALASNLGEASGGARSRRRGRVFIARCGVILRCHFALLTH